MEQHAVPPATSTRSSAQRVRSPQQMALIACAGAVGALGLLFVTWFLAFHIPVFERADVRILGGFIDLHHARLHSIASFIAGLCNPNPFVYFAGALVLLALARKRPGMALVIAAILLGANVTTQLLKPLLATPRAVPEGVGQIGSAAWPSGHATAAMSLALCSVLAAPARLRPAVAALGAAFAVAVSYSFLTLTWHYPSDVFGGFLVATVWTLLGIAVLYALRARFAKETPGDPAYRPSVGQALRPPAVALLGAIGLAVLVALARPHAVVAYTEGHTAFVVGACAIAALGLVLATGVMLALRR
jgi:membrane-associated phospholipid phosphatase